MLAAAENSTAPKRDAAESLDQRLRRQAGRSAVQLAVAKTVCALARAAKEIAGIIGRGPLAGRMADVTAAENGGGDSQKVLDVKANEIVLEALRQTATAYYASEEEDAILTLMPNGILAVAVDPLDGSSNIDTNSSIGTIFSIYEVAHEGASASFLRPGREQLAAGYFIYGPHTALVLTTGSGVDLYVLDRESGEFELATQQISVPADTREFAINASNRRHWPECVRAYIDDCLAGSVGPMGKEFNMRWIASLVAEVHRILMRGGIYLYPADARAGYQAGRLRLVYEAAPMALLMRECGASATDGTTAILEKTPAGLHERTALVLGSANAVATVARYQSGGDCGSESAPLFATRGLFRS